MGTDPFMNNIWNALPLGWKVGVILLLVLILVILPLIAITKRCSPTIAAIKVGPRFPELSDSGRLLFNGVLCLIVAIGGIVVLAMTASIEREGVMKARLGIALIAVMFLIKSIISFRRWKASK